MADFLTTRGISYHLDEIIKKSENNLYIITAYLKFSETLYESLLQAGKRKVKISIVYGKTELNKREENLLNNLNCNIYFKENLHGKCYINDNLALVCSMNMHSFSESNNREMGVLLYKKNDYKAYQDCCDEVQSIIDQSEPKRVLQIIEKKPEPVIVEPVIDFKLEWYEFLKHTFPNVNFYKEMMSNDNSNYRIIADNFPNDNMQLTTYSTPFGGILDLKMKGSKSILDKLRNKEFETLKNKLNNYRVFWNYPEKIQMYGATNKRFDNKQEELAYYKEGMKLAIEEIKKYFNQSEIISASRETIKNEESQILERDSLMLWYDFLTKSFPGVDFQKVHFYDNYYGFSANKFPNKNSNVTIQLASKFLTIQFEDASSILEKLKSQFNQNLNYVLKNYRVYWTKAEKIEIYKSKDIALNNVNEEIEYYGNGLKIAIEEIKKYVA